MKIKFKSRISGVATVSYMDREREVAGYTVLRRGDKSPQWYRDRIKKIAGSWHPLVKDKTIYSDTLIEQKADGTYGSSWELKPGSRVTEVN